jgi:hypothetical protein
MEPSPREANSRSGSRKFSNILCSPKVQKNPATGPYPAPDESSPYHRILFL